MIEKIIDLTVENINQFADDFLISNKLSQKDLEMFILKVNSSKPLLITLKANFEPANLGLFYDKKREIFLIQN
tara:strand:- start:175 stop:393 length:219 start_codon:yes stop_codon:yes gene_type:complete